MYCPSRGRVEPEEEALIVEDYIGQQFRSYRQFSVVVNQSHCPELVHEVRDTGTGCTHHFREGLMT